MNNLVEKIRNFFYWRFLKRRIANKTKKNVSGKKVNLESAHKIGILFDATDLNNRKTILDYVETLKDRRKAVKLLGFFDNRLKDNNFTFRHFNRDNIDWTMRPKGDQIEDFISQNYDLLININPTSTKATEYITALANAELKVGPLTDNNYCYDLMLDTENNIEIQQFIKQIEARPEKNNYHLMSLENLQGTGVALVTPFDDYKVDYPALSNIIEYVIAGGVDFIVSLGTTGEAITLSSQECRDILDFTIRQVNGRKPIVAGFFGGNFTKALADKISNYNFEGIAAIMCSSPAYSKPTQEGIFQHYMAIEAVSPIPIIIYNVPGRTSSNITAETTLRLAHASKKFIGVKEASGDLVQAMQIIKHQPDHFSVVSGEDPLTLPMIGCGAKGVISVIANAYPHTFSSMVNAALEGNFPLAQSLNDAVLEVHPWLYIENNPIGIKAAMEIRGMCSREMRIPLVPMSEENYVSLKSSMDATERLH